MSFVTENFISGLGRHFDMEGVIVNFRGTKHTKRGNYLVILPEGCKNKSDAEKLVGKKVVWTTPAKRQRRQVTNEVSISSKKEIKGEIKGAHGKKGAVKVLFEKGMPGQSLGKRVRIE